MKLKDLLLSRPSFADLLKQFSMNAEDIKIQDEEIILADRDLQHQEILKENIFIEGKTKEGVVNFFGTLHYNLLSQLAVFEMQGYERVACS